MKLITQPNAWTCTAAAAAMVFECEIKEIFAICGHDGSEILNDLPEPCCRKGHHVQEIVDVGWQLGYSMTPFEAMPVQLNSEHHEYDVPVSPMRIPERMMGCWGILIGKGRKCWHTVAWNGSMVFDPNGRCYPFNDCKIDIQAFWAVKEFWL